jgi:hypothetical protein
MPHFKSTVENLNHIGLKIDAEGNLDNDHALCYRDNVHNTLVAAHASMTYGNKNKKKKSKPVSSKVFHTNTHPYLRVKKIVRSKFRRYLRYSLILN